MKEHKQMHSDVITLSNNEKAVILHEDEASAVYSLIQDYLKLKTFDLTNEEDWSMIVYFKSLQEKLRHYLDNDHNDVKQLIDDSALRRIGGNPGESIEAFVERLFSSGGYVQWGDHSNDERDEEIESLRMLCKEAADMLHEMPWKRGGYDLRVRLVKASKK